MRFITEFEFQLPHSPLDIASRKSHYNKVMGIEISDAFGWVSPVDGNTNRHKLEIEAFPMDKWVEFRDRIIEESRKGRSNRTNNIIQMFQELESFGKPSGDAITNLSDQMEYRGQHSHCKACEDEKNGVKHIMAQKHTCIK